MSRTKKIAIIAVIVAILGIAIAIFALNVAAPDDAINNNAGIENLNNENTLNENSNDDYAFDSASGTYSENTANITENNNVSEPEKTTGGLDGEPTGADRVYVETDPVYPPNMGAVDSTTRESERIYAEEERKIAQVDQAAAKSNVNAFIKNFFTYNANSLKNDYYSTWSKYCSPEVLHDGTSSIIKQHGTSAWIANSATYKEVWSKAYDINVGDVSWSVYDKPYIVVTATVEENIEDLGTAGYQCIDKNRNRYAVYVNNAGLVTDVKLQKKDTIQENIFNGGLPHN